jgi:hypothetical protein
MTQFTPCAGRTACRDDNTTCLTCGRSLASIETTRRLIDELAALAIAEGYENLEAFTDYVSGKVIKKVRHRRDNA